MGFSKNEYLNYFQAGHCKIGIQIMKPIKKTRINLNLIDTKKAKLMSRIKTRTQIKTEFLKDVKYRLYVYHDDQQLYNKLKFFLQEHKAVYSVSLGLSENLANFNYCGEFELEKISENREWIEMSSVLRIDNCLSKGDIDFSQPGKEYFSDEIALEMKNDREVTDYGQILFERNGESIKARPTEYYRLDNEINCLLI